MSHRVLLPIARRPSVAVALLSLGLAFQALGWGRKPPVDESQRIQAEIESRMAAEKQLLATRAAKAVADGKAVMLVPLYGTRLRDDMPASLETGLDQPFSLDVMFYRAGSQGGPGHQFNLARRDSQLISAYHGKNERVYALQIVEPGDWVVTGFRINLRDAPPPEVTVKREPRDSGFGKVYFGIQEFPKQVTEQRWKPPTFKTRDISADVCLTVRMPHGQCVQWGSVVVDRVREVASTGGWYDVVRTIQRPGLVVTAAPAQPVASVSVAAGEVVLLDGLFFKPPGLQFVNECAQVNGNTVACELNSVDYQVWPTDPALFVRDLGPVGAKTYVEAIKFGGLSADPALIAVLRKAVHRPYALRGKAGWSDPQWGQNWYIEAGK